jgi:hypothetical protein
MDSLDADIASKERELKARDALNRALNQIEQNSIAAPPPA